MKKRARISSAGSTGCSRWRSGTAAASGWCWRGTGWARSRSITVRCPAAASRLARSPRRFWRIRRSAGPSIAQSLARYLFYEYVPAPDSIWRSMRKLPGGHVLTWERGEVRVCEVLGPSGHRARARALDFDATAERFWSEFRDSVARHRRSDVPIGVFLSGGVDSSSVAAALCEVEPARTCGPFRSASRTPASTRAATPARSPAIWGPTITSGLFRSRRPTTSCPRWPRWLDEPFGDASILPTHLLSRFAREQVKVVLGGDGADELLAGYPTFTAERAAGLFRRLPRPAQALAGAAVGRLPVNHGNFSLDFKLKQFLRGAAEPLAAGPPALAGLVLRQRRSPGCWSDGDPIGVEREHLRRCRGPRRVLPTRCPARWPCTRTPICPRTS